MKVDERVIGQFIGQEEGPLVIAIAATHGNEPAGVAALTEVFRMLEEEARAVPDFFFKGQITGLIGNLTAYKAGQRFIDKDLNRIWNPEFVDGLLKKPIDELQNEEQELVQLLLKIRSLINQSRAKHLIIIDLHTTSAEGGIFSIPLEDDQESIQLAATIHAPVVLGLLKGLSGTLMHYASGNHFLCEGLPEKVCCVAFEAGQHFDPLSVNRSISAVISILRATACIGQEDVDHQHDDILLAYTADLPKLTRIMYVHHIGPDDHFTMHAGYVNFQPVHKGEQLAIAHNGPVFAPQEGLILMPLYQPKGTDGFFIVEVVKN
jgi:succinylglutamate desuccinylase